MAKFYGEIGFGESAKTAPGVWEDVVKEYKYYGDVLRNTRRLTDGMSVNSDILASNSISIVADAYARDNYANMKYVMWNGTRWVVATVEVVAPRLILHLGGVYNGPTS